MEHTDIGIATLLIIVSIQSIYEIYLILYVYKIENYNGSAVQCFYHLLCLLMLSILSIGLLVLWYLSIMDYKSASGVLVIVLICGLGLYLSPKKFKDPQAILFHKIRPGFEIVIEKELIERLKKEASLSQILTLDTHRFVNRGRVISVLSNGKIEAIFPLDDFGKAFYRHLFSYCEISEVADTKKSINYHKIIF